MDERKILFSGLPDLTPEKRFYQLCKASYSYRGRDVLDNKHALYFNLSPLMTFLFLFVNAKIMRTPLLLSFVLQNEPHL